jgi:hypothetical protein
MAQSYIVQTTTAAHLYEHIALMNTGFDFCEQGIAVGREGG